MGFGPQPVHFRRGPSTIFRTDMPWGIGTASYGIIGYVFAGNGPLNGGLESSLNGTVRGPKGDFIRFSYLYRCIFDSRTHTFFESTCPELYAQQSGEWSDAYLWRIDLYKMVFKHVSKGTSGVLTVISNGLLASTRAFPRGAPSIFRISNGFQTYQHTVSD